MAVKQREIVDLVFQQVHFVCLFADQRNLADNQEQEIPNEILLVDFLYSNELIFLIKKRNEMYDAQYGEEGTLDGRIEYVLEDLDKEIPFIRISTSGKSKAVYL